MGMTILSIDLTLSATFVDIRGKYHPASAMAKSSRVFHSVEDARVAAQAASICTEAWNLDTLA